MGLGILTKRRTIIVAHGSRNPRWLAEQEAWFDGVCERLCTAVPAPMLSYLEISKPLFADVLAEIDGSAETIEVLPFFISRSGHAGEEIPEMVSEILKKSEGRILDARGMARALGENAARRLRELGAQPGEPVVVSGYGASKNNGQWRGLVKSLRQESCDFAESPWRWAPAGHFLPDSKAPLRQHLSDLSARGVRNAAILPFYLSISSYQEKLIPETIREFPNLKIDFEPTAVLPDPAMEQWAANLIAGKGATA